MNEPSPRTSRLALAGGIAAAIVIGGGGVLIGRSTAPSLPPVEAPRAAPSPAPSRTPTAIALPTMDRADMLALANRATDAAASGAPIPEDVRAAAGRRFDLVLPFGCEGPSALDRAAGSGWRYDAESETLRIRVNPTRWSPGDWMLADGDGSQASLEGFWIGRPWSSSPQCLPLARRGAATDSEPVLLPGQTLAIARIVREGAERAVRPLETVQRIAREDLDPAKGFHLRIIGRIDSAKATEPVRCVQPAGSEQRPLCLIRGDFTEVRIENPANGAVLAAWPMTGPAPRDD